MPRIKKRMLCPHCSESLSHSAYFRHKELYYRDGTWKVQENQRNQGLFLAFFSSLESKTTTKKEYMFFFPKHNVYKNI